MKKVMSYHVQFGTGGSVKFSIMVEGSTTFVNLPGMSPAEGAVVLSILTTRNAHMDNNYTFHTSEAYRMPFTSEDTSAT